MPIRIRSGELIVRVLVEPERHLRSAHEDRTFDQVRLFHHEVDGLLLRLGQRPCLEYRAARAHEVEKAVFVDVLLEERAIRRCAIDVTFLDVNRVLFQKTSGVAARRSGGLPVEERLRH